MNFQTKHYKISGLFGLILTLIFLCLGSASAAIQSSALLLEQKILTQEETVTQEDKPAQESVSPRQEADTSDETVEVLPMGHIQLAVLKAINVFYIETAELLHSVGDVQHFWTWIKQQFSDQQARAFWQEFLMVLTSSFTAGLLLRMVLSYGIKRLCGRLLLANALPAWRRAINKILSALLGLLPVASFAVVSYFVLALLSPQHAVQKLALMCLNAYILMSAAAWLVKVLFNNHSAAWRLLPVSDASASVWKGILTRIMRVGIYGYFFVQFVYMLGAPAVFKELLLFMLVVTLVVMVLRYVHKNKQAVTHFLIELQQQSENRSMSLLIKWLKHSWHWLITLYILLAFCTWLAFRSDGINFMLTASIWTLLLIGGCWFVQQYFLHALRRKLHSLQRFPQRHPFLSLQWQRYGRFLKVLGNIIFYTLAILLLLQAWHINLLAWLVYGEGREGAGIALRITAIVAIVLFVWFTLSAVIG